MVNRSAAMEQYSGDLLDYLARALGVAAEARARGIDPRTDVEIPVASDLADRVEALLAIRGIAGRIRELEATMSREEAALRIGDDFVARKFGEQTREEILDHAIRTAMAMLTEGVVAAPTEGIAKVAIGKNDDGSEYLRIFYAGPIRSAGGTAQALSVLVGDYVRRELGINRYIPRTEEVERYIEEIRQYNSIMNLQYLPSEKEIRLIVENCPVSIDGEGTEQEEVSGYRNLDRIETNAVRGGMALVLAEGLALKAPKLQKYVRSMKMDGWEWLGSLSTGAARSTTAGDEEEKILPRDKYLRDLIGGRPVFSYPMRKGGFRLRYGRSRNTGFAAAGINPATMHILGDFLAVGTQMKIERPGKAAGIVPVDTIEGPTVRLTNGDVIRIDDHESAAALSASVDRILDIGEILISYGEFLENNHLLIPPSYCEEWWNLESGCTRPENELEAASLCCDGKVLHPAYTYFWDDIGSDKLRQLADFVSKNGEIRHGILVLPNDPRIKGILEEILIPHMVREDMICISSYLIFLACIGLDLKLRKRDVWENIPEGDGLACAMHLSGFRMRSKGGTRIGGRMGRPGKSKPRKMNPPPHSLFPLGEAGGSRRSFQEAANHAPEPNRDGGIIQIEVGKRRCPACGAETFRNRCECGTHTVPVFSCPRCRREISGPECPHCRVSTTCS
ncbi:MAG: DNA polymerase II large subunit, partial [Methanomicrobiales archaeon]|nr:DNA polymerase II large subunit [Methanomicrobiales archaeon]